MLYEKQGYNVCFVNYTFQYNVCPDNNNAFLKTFKNLKNCFVLI